MKLLKVSGICLIFCLSLFSINTVVNAESNDLKRLREELAVETNKNEELGNTLNSEKEKLTQVKKDVETLKSSINNAKDMTYDMTSESIGLEVYDIYAQNTDRLSSAEHEQLYKRPITVEKYTHWQQPNDFNILVMNSGAEFVYTKFGNLVFLKERQANGIPVKSQPYVITGIMLMDWDTKEIIMYQSLRS